MAPLTALLALAILQGAPDESKSIPLDGVDLSLRFTFPGGRVTGIGGGPKYRDLFDTGVGFGAAGDYFWVLSPSFKLGAYAEIAYDRFGGGSARDLFGNTITVDGMSTIRVMGGAKAREPLAQGSRFFLEQDTYLGAVVYPDVGGGSSAGPGDLDLFKGGTAISLGFDVGAGYRAGERVDLLLSFGIELAGGPGKGDDLGILTLNSSKDPEALLDTVIRIGATIRF